MNYLTTLLLIYFGISQINAQCESTPTTVSGSQAPNGPLCKGQLIFQDEFDFFDQSKWDYESMRDPPNEEFEYYTDRCCDNSFVRDGILYIKPSLTSASRAANTRFDGIGPVTSARLITLDTFSFKYGYVEMVAKSPTGDWLWPALWMLPKDEVYGWSPRSGEIDLLETRGNTEYTIGGDEYGTKFMESTLHWGPDDEHNQFARTDFEHRNQSSPYNEGFHKYSVEWTTDHITLMVDDMVLGRVEPPDGGFWELGELWDSGYDNIWGSNRMAPFDQEFYFIFNVAIGGAYFPDDAKGSHPKPWRDGSASARDDFWNARDQWLPTWNLEGSDQAALQVDYIRVYAM